MKHRGTDGTDGFTEESLQERVRARYHGREPLPESYNELTRAVIGAALEVHRTLGPGFLESFYETSMCIELERRRIPFRQQVPIAVSYKDVPIGTSFLDLVVDGRLVIELKAVESISTIHRVQLLSYLKAIDLPLGLIINFNAVLLRDGLARVIQTNPI